MVQTSFNDIRRLGVVQSDEKYFSNPALGHSQIARFIKEGFACIKKMFEPQEEKDCFIFGGLLDCMLTSPDELRNRYIIQSSFYSKDTDGYAIACKLFELHKDKEFNDIPTDDIVKIKEELNAWKSYKDPEKIRKRAEDDCKNIFNDMKVSYGRTLVTPKQWSDATNCVEAIMKNPYTRFFFKPWEQLTPDEKKESRNVFAFYRNLKDTDVDPFTRYYQVQFFTELDGVNVKCKPDILLCNYSEKKILLVDLKSSSFPEIQFVHKAFLDLNYMSEANLYSRIIEKLIRQDNEYKDFIISDFQFCVVCPETLTPLVYSFDENLTVGDFCIEGSKRNYYFKDPVNAAKRLQYYLDHPEIDVPDYLTKYSSNSVKSFLQNM